jgi:hypothetical protein
LATHLHTHTHTHRQVRMVQRDRFVFIAGGKLNELEISEYWKISKNRLQIPNIPKVKEVKMETMSE